VFLYLVCVLCCSVCGVCVCVCEREMVMEKPSPLLVGREFVRQYYTLLNKAPDYLHR